MPNPTLAEKQFLLECAAKWDLIAAEWRRPHANFPTSAGLCLTVEHLGTWRAKGRVPSMKEQLYQAGAGAIDCAAWPWFWPRTRAYRPARAALARKLARRCRTLAAGEDGTR